MSTLIAAAIVTNAPAHTIAVVALDDAPATANHIANVTAELFADGDDVLTAPEIFAALGALPPDSPNAAALQADLERARKLDAEWQTPEANRLRQAIIDAIQPARPGAELARIGTEAAHDLAAALLADANDMAAATAAHKALRLFGDAPLDTQRHSPAIRELFDNARKQTVSRVQVRVTTNRSAMLLAGARELGLVRDEITAELEPGTYYLWLKRQDAKSLTHEVVVGEAPVEVAIDFDFESQVGLTNDVVRLACTNCESMLASLRTKLGVDEVVGVAANGERTTAGTAEKDIQAPATPQATKTSSPVEPDGWPRFHPLYLLPLGGGQFAQGRWAFGASYLAACLGLGAWHLAAQLEFARLNDYDHVDETRSLKTQGDVSLWLLVGVGVGAVVEAVVVGLLFGTGEATE
jgi:hypothetical protein